MNEPVRQYTPERRLRIDGVVSQTGLSRAGVYRKEKTDSTFPRHIKEGTSSFWLESEIQAWIRQSVEKARAA